MIEENTLNLSKNDQQTLQHLSDLTHLFHHRNKNQHRRSVWWRHFSIFRRQLNSLLDEILKLQHIPKTHLERTRKKTKDVETTKRISERLDLWQNVLVPRWHNAFSQVIADGRFAVLGLGLTAILAQTCQIVCITATLEDSGQKEVEQVLHDFGVEYWGADSERNESVGGGHDEDLGESVARNAVETKERTDGEGIGNSVEAGSSKRAQSITKRKPASKKRKKGNAIDDLFSGLD